MRWYEMFANQNQEELRQHTIEPKRTANDFRVELLPESELEKKIGKMEREIERDHKESDIDVPLHMRNEYYDDSYEDSMDDETESQLLDREVNRASMQSRGVQPPKLPYPTRRPG